VFSSVVYAQLDGGGSASANVGRGFSISGAAYRATLTVSSSATHGVNGMRVRVNNVQTGARTEITEASQNANFASGRTVTSNSVNVNSGQTARGNYWYRRQGTTTWRAVTDMDSRRP